MERVYKIDGKFIERGMTIKVFTIDEIAKQGRFLDIIDFLGQKVMKIDCSGKYNSSIAEVNVVEIKNIEIVE